jgi:hypothetical protein
MSRYAPELWMGLALGLAVGMFALTARGVR